MGSLTIRDRVMCCSVKDAMVRNEFGENQTDHFLLINQETYWPCAVLLLVTQLRPLMGRLQVTNNFRVTILGVNPLCPV